MQKTIFFIFFAGVLLFTSCNTSDPKTEEKEVSIKNVVVSNSEDEKAEDSVVKKPLLKADEFLLAFEELRILTIEKLKLATPQIANQLYLDYKKKVAEITDKLNQEETTMLDDYDGLYDDEGYFRRSGKYGARIKKYLSAGFELWYVGEGMTEIRVRPVEYPNLFSGRVTDDFQEFIENEEWDNRELMFNDAGLSISLEQFSWIVRRWERFVQKYPKSKLKPEAKELYGYYQSFYLFGLDNTPVLEHSDGKIYPENRANFEMFMGFYPESPTSKLIKTLMSLEGNYEAMSEAVIKQQNQLMNKM